MARKGKSLSGVMVTLDKDLQAILKARAKALEGIDDTTRRVLDRFGSLTMQDAKRKIGSPTKRKGKGDTRRKEIKARSAPGAPRARSSHPYASLRNIKYEADFRKRKVIVGPVGLGRKKTSGGQTIPALHEYGGTQRVMARLVPIETVYRSKKKQRYEFATKVAIRAVPKLKRGGGNIKGFPFTFRYPKRPFMKPAMVKQIPKAIAYFKDAISKKGSFKSKRRK